MKKIYTLLFAICITSSISAQQVSIGIDGNEIYYKTEANIYLASLLLTFENEITTSSVDNVSSWQTLYGGVNSGPQLTINSGKLWTVTMSDDNKTMLIYSDASGAFKPTSDGEYVKFFKLSNENKLVSIDDAAGFLSEDTNLVPAEAITPSFAINSSLSLGNFENSPELKIYPNPTTGNRVLISGLNETLEARIYDVMGREILNTSVSPSESSIDISNLKSNVYLLKLKNDKSSRVHTIVRH
jgi:hypothetical protein